MAPRDDQPPTGAVIDRDQLVDEIARRARCSAYSVSVALERQRASGGSLLVELIFAGAVDANLLLEAFATSHGLEQADGDIDTQIRPEIFGLVPTELVYRAGVLPIRVTDADELIVGVVDPYSLDAIEEAEFFSGFEIVAKALHVDTMERAFETLTGQLWRAGREQPGGSTRDEVETSGTRSVDEITALIDWLEVVDPGVMSTPTEPPAPGRRVAESSVDGAAAWVEVELQEGDELDERELAEDDAELPIEQTLQGSGAEEASELARERAWREANPFDRSAGPRITTSTRLPLMLDSEDDEESAEFSPLPDPVEPTRRTAASSTERRRRAEVRARRRATGGRPNVPEGDTLAAQSGDDDSPAAAGRGDGQRGPNDAGEEAAARLVQMPERGAAPFDPFRSGYFSTPGDPGLEQAEFETGAPALLTPEPLSVVYDRFAEVTPAPIPTTGRETDGRIDGRFGETLPVVESLGDPSALAAAGFRDAIRALDIVAERDAIAREVVESLAVAYHDVLLFSLRGPTLRVWDGAVARWPATSLLGRRFEIRPGSVWHRVADRLLTYRGPLPAKDLMRSVAPQLEGQDTIVTPIALNRRCVAVLLLDAGPYEGLSPPGFLLEQLQSSISRAMRRVILQRKHGTLVPG